VADVLERSGLQPSATGPGVRPGGSTIQLYRDGWSLARLGEELGSPPTPCVATCSWVEWLCAHRTNGVARRLGGVYRPEL